MRQLVRSVAVAGALLSLLAADIAGAGAPAGPRLAVIKETSNPWRMTLLTVDANGRRPQRLAGGQESGPLGGLGRLAWRPDGTEVAFQGIRSIFLARADGGGTEKLNIADAERPVFAADGRTLAFTRFERRRKATIWTFDLVTGVQRRLTPSRRGLEYVGSSFSPDGAILLATRIDRKLSGEPELVALNPGTGAATRLLERGFGAVYSPDGSKMAFFRETGEERLGDLFVLDLASRSLRRLTRTPHKDEVFATWDPSGERLAFARFRGLHYQWANAIVQINADGSCESEILARKRTVFYGPAWQPGPGREAGRIRC